MRVYTLSFAWHLQSHAPTSSDGAVHITLLGKPEMSMDSSTSMRNNMYQYLLALQANVLIKNAMVTQPQLAICHPVGKPGKSVDQMPFQKKSKQPCCLKVGNGPLMQTPRYYGQCSWGKFNPLNTNTCKCG